MLLTHAYLTVSFIDMQIGPFTTLIADTLAEDEKTVAIYLRELRVAGLLTTGARGVNAPHMLPLDAARVILALLATDRPSQAVAMVNRYGAMRASRDGLSGDLADLLADNPTLEQVLIRIIAAEPGEVPTAPYIEVRRWDKSMLIEVGGSKAIFRDTLSTEDRRERRGKLVSCGLMPAALMEFSVTLWADRFRGVDRSGLPLDLHHAWNIDLPEPTRTERYDYMREYVRKRDVDWRKGA